MTTSTTREDTPRRADARRNIAAILDAATSCLARDPDVSVNAVAKAAGVGRVTLYGHFESRAALVEAVVDRAIRQTDDELSRVDLTGDPCDAMGRLMAVTWDLTLRFGALVVAAQRTLPAERFRALHETPAIRVEKLLRRGRRAGTFRDDVPLSWQITTIQALVHGGTESAYRGEVTAERGRELVVTTIIAALLAPQAQ